MKNVFFFCLDYWNEELFKWTNYSFFEAEHIEEAREKAKSILTTSPFLKDKETRVVHKTPSYGQCGLEDRRSRTLGELLIQVASHAPHEERSKYRHLDFDDAISVLHSLSNNLLRARSSKTFLRLEKKRRKAVERMIENFVLWGWDAMLVLQMRKELNML